MFNLRQYIILAFLFYATSFVGLNFGYYLFSLQFEFPTIIFITFYLVFLGTFLTFAVAIPSVIQYSYMENIEINLFLLFFLPIFSAISVYEATGIILQLATFVAYVEGPYDFLGFWNWVNSSSRNLFLGISMIIMIFGSVYAPAWALNLRRLRHLELMRKKQYMYFISLSIQIAVLIFYHLLRHTIFS